MERIKVENLQLKDGNTYTGSALVINSETIPDGYGVKLFKNGRATGSFRMGLIDGPAYYVREDSMTMGVFSKQRLNGWGINMRHGQFWFGVFKDSNLVTDLSEEVEWMMNEIRKSSNKRWAYVYPKPKEVFLGIPGGSTEFISGAYKGFHFYDNGDLYVGQMFDFNKSGNFIKYSNDGSVAVGEWEDGIQIKSFSIQDLFDIHYGVYDPDDIFYKMGHASSMDLRKELNNVTVDTSTNYFNKIN